MTKTPSTHSREDLGRVNRRRVLHEIHRSGSVHRTSIARRTGLTAASVSRITRQLIDRGLVVETSAARPKPGPGPRFVELTLNPEAGYVIAIGCNAFFQWVSLTNLRNEVVARRELGLDSFSDPDFALEALAEAVETIILEAGIDRSRILGGGVAIAGVVDPDRGAVLSSPHLGWGQVDVVSVLGERLNLPFCIESTANAVNLAESRAGVARDHDNVVLVSASLGVAASLLLDGQLRRGRDHTAGLIGRLPVYGVDHSRAMHSDMALNDVAGGWAVLAALDGVDAGVVPKVGGSETARRVMECKDRAERGDVAVINVFEDAGRRLGQALDSVVGLLRPDLALLAGSLASVPSYVDGVRQGFASGSAASDDPVPLEVSHLTNDVAARNLALDEFLLCRHEILNRLLMEAS